MPAATFYDDALPPRPYRVDVLYPLRRAMTFRFYERSTAAEEFVAYRDAEIPAILTFEPRSMTRGER